MAQQLRGMLGWEISTTAEGHREYKSRWLVKQNNALDGPGMALLCPGLPRTGDIWNYGNEFDAWAYCTPEMSAKPVVDKEKHIFWLIETKHSTAPGNRCQDQSIENPLDEPPRLSGSFVKQKRAQMYDKNGKLLQTSSFEPYKGNAIERDISAPTVSVELTLPGLPLQLIASFQDCCNDSEVWGLEPRMLWLNSTTWSRKVYGKCNYYYIVGYEFGVDYKKGVTRLVDEGWKKLGPGGTATNPKHYILNTDDNKNPVRTLLNGAGVPLDAMADPVFNEFEFGEEKNFYELGIPSSL